MRSPHVKVQIRKNQKSSWVDGLVFSLNIFHVVPLLAMFYYSWMMFLYGEFYVEFNRDYRYNIYVLALYVVLLFFFMYTYNGYILGYIPVKRLIFYQFLSQFLSITVVYFIVTIAWAKFRSPIYFLFMLAAQLVYDIIWTVLSNRLYIRLHGTRSTVLVYGHELDKKFFSVMVGKPSEKLYKIEKELLYSGDNFNDIREEIQGYDAVFAAGVHLHCRNELMKYCKEVNMPVFFMPTVGDIIVKESGHLKSFDAPVFFVTRSGTDPDYAFFKRVFDVLLSGIGLLALSPIMLICALVIHFNDGGPVFYKQDRLTNDGKIFKIFKFRSMRVDAESDGVARLSTGDKDDRVTSVGRFMRKCRLDELPQLWNIFRGDMSFVGPRPERPEIAEQLYEYLPDFHLRLQTKAGLTGYAQIYGRYNSDPYEKLVFDLLYINSISLKTDIMLIFATIAILFSSNSTKGVEQKQEQMKPEDYREFDILHGSGN